MADKKTSNLIKDNSYPPEENLMQKFNINFKYDKSESSSSEKIIEETKKNLLKPSLKSPKREKLNENPVKTFAWKEGDQTNEGEQMTFFGQNTSSLKVPILNLDNKELSENSKSEIFASNEFVLERTRISADWLKNKNPNDYFLLILNAFCLVALKKNLKIVYFF